MRKYILFALVILGIGCARMVPFEENEMVLSQDKISITQKKGLKLQKDLGRLENEIAVLKEKLRKKDEIIEELKKQKLVLIQMPTGFDIQNALKNAGFYKGEIDGKIGSGTKKATSEFQESQGLVADGVMGSKTWAKLKVYFGNTDDRRQE